MKESDYRFSRAFYFPKNCESLEVVDSCALMDSMVDPNGANLELINGNQNWLTYYPNI